MPSIVKKLKCLQTGMFRLEVFSLLTLDQFSSDHRGQTSFLRYIQTMLLNKYIRSTFKGIPIENSIWL
jgi:hypothetical protein